MFTPLLVMNLEHLCIDEKQLQYFKWCEVGFQGSLSLQVWRG